MLLPLQLLDLAEHLEAFGGGVAQDDLFAGQADPKEGDRKPNGA
jgi:hypothetical protein